MRSYLAALVLTASASVSALTPQEEIEVFAEHLEVYNAFDEFPSEVEALKAAIYERIDFIVDKTLFTDRFAVVNLKSFKFQLIEHRVEVLNEKVIVGRESRPTPLFSDKLTHVVINPYWNVPYSLAKRDVIPKVRKNPGKIGSYGYQMLNRKTQKVVPFSTNANLSKYRIRQLPGPRNSLGLVKFMFPPKQGRNIYIHDTPSRHLFNKTKRQYSSGCIRLQNPFKLAKYLVPEKDLKSLQLKGSTEKWFKIPEPIDVHIVSWSTWVDDEGVVQYE